MANAVHEFEPNFTFVHTRLGYSYSGKGMYAEAVTAFQDAIKAGDNTASTQSIWVWLTRGRASASGRRRFSSNYKQPTNMFRPANYPFSTPLWASGNKRLHRSKKPTPRTTFNCNIWALTRGLILCAPTPAFRICCAASDCQSKD